MLRLMNFHIVSVEYFGIDDVYNLTVDDNHNYHVITSHEDDRYVISSGLCVKNCGELHLPMFDSCRLLIVNLAKFVLNPWTVEAKFDYESFGKAVVVAQRLMDDLVDLEIEAINRIITKIESDPEPNHVKERELLLWNRVRSAATDARRTGLGVTAVGDTLAMLGIKYGSDESIANVEEFYKALAVNSWKSSCILASERGAFPIFEHAREVGHSHVENILSQDSELRALYNKHGRRNIALTTTAPVGSVSMLTQTTSGIEPVLSVSGIRSKKINSDNTNVRVDRVDDQGIAWQEYRVFHYGVKQWMNATGNTNWEESPYKGSTCVEIDWMSSVRMQAKAQKYIDHSISKTCNLPADVTPELVKRIYLEAWTLGCKGFTIYRQGTRQAVYVSDEENKKKAEDAAKIIVSSPPPSTDAAVDSSFIFTNAQKRPKELECELHRANVFVGGETQSYLVIVGLLDGAPYEVFCGLCDKIEIPKKTKRGVLIKNGKKESIALYNLKVPVGEDSFLIKDIVGVFENKLYGSLTRMLSLSLRHGVPIQYICEQLQKDKYSEIMSFSRVVARVLKHYIKDGTKATIEKTCTTCGAAGTVVYQEGCMSCTNCGASKCS
jgi:ribonucleoside-diphosphate reductase alpha chain